MHVSVGPDGSLYVANSGAGQGLRQPDKKTDGEADSINIIADGFKNPSSLVFYKDGSLHVAETTRVWNLSHHNTQGVYQERQVVIDGLPRGGHFTRTLLFSPDESTL